ncbi:hypothetical protein D0Y65_048129 [Glycine soja]|uniref:Uncharacterized protein n=1 Tax=Glycine soja TaxID=3848 RepID=A0A445FRT2_GLYSO|nr:hypothetical protein D0Y65_048129 [Glycine soja]
MLSEYKLQVAAFAHESQLSGGTPTSIFPSNICVTTFIDGRRVELGFTHHNQTIAILLNRLKSLSTSRSSTTAALKLFSFARYRTVITTRCSVLHWMQLNVPSAKYDFQQHNAKAVDINLCCNSFASPKSEIFGE